MRNTTSDTMTEAGFTLLEILVALSVFAILATLTSSAMYHALNTRAHVTRQADRLNTLQLAMAFIQQDTQQITTRAVHGDQLRLYPAFIGRANYIEFTRGGEVNPGGNFLRSTLLRVAYLCKQDQFIRRSWESLDTPHRANYQDRVLISHLEHCQFAFLAHNQHLLAEWRENALTQNQHPEPLPTALQLTFNLKDWGNMSLLFIIPEALYAE